MSTQYGEMWQNVSQQNGFLKNWILGKVLAKINEKNMSVEKPNSFNSI